MVNIICDRALLGAYVQGKSSVDRKTLINAAHEVTGKTDIQIRKRKLLQWIAASLLLISSLAALGVTYFTYKPRRPATIASESFVSPIKHSESAKSVTLHWPTGQPIEKSQTLAFQSLFRQWNLPYQEKDEACKQAEPHGLRCLKVRGSLNDLVRLNRPAVLKLFDDTGKSFYVTVTDFQNNIATLMAGKEQLEVDKKDIERSWTGDFVIFWRTPGNYHGSMHQGYQGPEVEWLYQKLSLAQGVKPQSLKSPVYDESLVKQVKKFQLSEGLLSDGVVGSQTIIHLNNATGSSEPLLVGEKAKKL